MHSPRLTADDCPVRIDILLATRNGAAYLDRQIESILAQWLPGCRLLVRDDGSTDGTVELLDRYVRHSGRAMRRIQDDDGRLGPCGNFARLLACSDADYVVLCDQDNVWLPGRISAPLARIQTLEQRLGRDAPILVHTDMAVADAALRPIAPSFWAYGGLDPASCTTLNRLLVQNVVAGCAATLNGALVRLARPIPQGALMHDWWLALVAAAFGTLDWLAQPTVIYRQHAGNAVGIRGMDWAYLRDKAAHCLGGDAMRGTDGQAAALLGQFEQRLPPRQRDLLEAYAGLKRCGFWQRRRKIARYRFLGCGWLRNLAWLATV
jgi:hypothetical protein